MYILTLVLPVLSFLALGFFGRFIGRFGSVFLSVTLVGLAAVAAIVTYYEVMYSDALCVIQCFSWFSTGALFQSFGFLFDTVTATMLVVVLIISFFVHLYSSSYMGSDPYLIRFMSYLSLFTFFMLCLVTSDNFAQMFLGWEGVGLSSYLLINFWFTRLAANKAAIKAVIVNRFGDFALVVGMMISYLLFRSFNYGLIFSIIDNYSEMYITLFVWEVHALSLLSFFLLIGCVGKSAQLGLHTWLPDAMEGPTPVSALIHAATMVTAGVFILVRFAPVLELSPSILGLVIVMGAFTALFAGTIGIFQNDLKRVIAYSTCSQLGYMVLACGLSNYSLALFHLLNHAFFKALLFLSAGAVIHAVSDEQDMRKMGGLVRLLPFTYVCFLVGSLALSGFPYTTGFYSKDAILEVTYGSQFTIGFFGYICGIFAAGCTAFYSFRLLYLTFLSESNTNRTTLKIVHESNFPIILPLCCLALFSIFIGYILRDRYIGMGADALVLVLFQQNLSNILGLNSEFFFVSEKLLPIFVSMLLIYLSWVLYSFLPSMVQVTYLNKTFKTMLSSYFFFNKKWYFDNIYNNFVTYNVLSAGNVFIFKLLDRGVIETAGPTGLVRFWVLVSRMLSKWQSGYMFNYIFYMVIFVFFLIVNQADIFNFSLYAVGGSVVVRFILVKKLLNKNEI